MSSRKKRYVVIYWNGFNARKRHFDPKTKTDEFTETVAVGHAQKVVAGGAVRAEVRSIEDGVEGGLIGRFERTADGGCLRTGSRPTVKKVEEKNEDSNKGSGDENPQGN